MKHLAARYLALTVRIILVPIGLVSFSPKRSNASNLKKLTGARDQGKMPNCTVFVVAEV